ncbi:toll/interleukin-1 receptor domain-containing protein [Streptomyces massasporeus]|uniref:toll/interleukin-1 receptor domain-containing protein n=1 Tax=Streptomyces massasporeus TaxID=67324 RepID=UPI0036C32511
MTSNESPGEGGGRTQQRVFISHGSKESPFSWQVCEEIQLALTDAGYAVFLDRSSIHQRAGWEEQIRRQLAGCHAAVFVIARRALTREWVRREAEILRQRYDIEDIFLVVVLLDDLRPEDLEEAELSVLNVRQALKYGETAEAGPIAADVVKEFAELPPLPHEDELTCEWVERISAILKLASSSDLETVARLLGLEEQQVRRAGNFNGRRFLARTLLGSGLGETVYEALPHLNAVLARSDLLAEEMEPTWVDEQAARAFVPDEDAGEGRVILLNASIKQTAEHHIGRAMRRKTTRYLNAPLNVLRPDEEESTTLVIDELRAVLRTRLAIPDDGEWPSPTGRHVYVLVPVESRACRRRLAAVVEGIRDKAPWLHVVALLEGGPPDDTVPKRWGLEDAVVVRPALDNVQEESGHYKVQRLYEAVGRQHEMPEPWRATCP